MKIAVIPARGGSKRIPRKNIRAFGGRPMIGYPIEAARRCGLFDEVVVSTDDEEIAEVARTLGASTPFIRPAALADDHTGTNAVVAHALRWFADAGRPASMACCIYATAPFIRAEDIVKGHAALVERGHRFAFSITSFPAPIQRALGREADGSVFPMQPEHIGTRSQDLPEWFHDAAQFYWGLAEAFLDGTVLFSKASYGVVIPRHRVQDIDTPEDWLRAELMLPALKAAGEIDP